ncbi:MAG: RAMP superfamily CRISPR-associated protein, partial [Candidatus Caldarchaeum sp.]
MNKIVLSLKPVGLFSLGFTHPRALGPDVSFAAKPVLLNGKTSYIPYIPGSSVKGALRSAATRIAGHDPQALHAQANTLGFTSCNESLSKLMRECDVCNLFGKPGIIYPKVFFGDFNCEKPPKPRVLTKVGIEDKSSTASEHALYSIEYITPQTIFKGEISYMRLTEREMELL